MRGGWESSADLTASVLNEMINDAIVEAYDLMVERWADYYTRSAQQAVVAGTDSYALATIASDFYKLRRVWILRSGAEYQRLYPADLDVAHEYTADSTVSGKGYRYRMMGANLILMPVPVSAETLRIYYIPLPTVLVSDSDSLPFDVPVEQKLVLQIAFRDALQRQELPTQEVEARIADLTGKLRCAADNRDAAEPFYLDAAGPPAHSWDADSEWW